MYLFIYHQTRTFVRILDRKHEQMYYIKIYILKKAIFKRFKTRKNKININYQLTTKNLLKWLKIPKNNTISNQHQHHKQQKTQKIVFLRV